MFTVKQSLAFHRCRCLHHGRHPTDCTLRKINAGNRLIDLECPRLARLRFHMSPVIKAKGHVAVLLNFEHHDVAAESVNRSSLQENAVAGLWSELCELVHHRPVL